MNDIKFTSDALNISKQPATNINGSPVLCTLEGIVADFKNPTRNGRFYSKQLWEKALKSDMVQEQIANGGIMMELNHPADRDETDLSCVAAIMPELPKESKDGKLTAKVHIIDTPMGRIANTLARYGYKLGISSRGNGEVNYDGSVNEDTYELQCWDLVAMPSVKDARLSLVTESLNKQTLTESLNKIVEQSNDDDKKHILEKLAQLNITLTSENTGEAKEVSIPVEVETDKDGNIAISESEEISDSSEAVPEVTIDAAVVYNAQSEVETQVENDENASEVSDDNIEVNDEEDAAGGAEVSVITDLQESLKQNGKLKAANEKLRNSLSVSIAKEQSLNEELSHCKNKIAELVESQKKLVGLQARANKFEENNKTLSESMEKINSQNTKLNRMVNLQKVNIHQLEKQNERMEQKHNRQLSSLQEKLNQVTEDKSSMHDEYSSKLNDGLYEAKQLKESFNQSINELKNNNIQLAQYNKSLETKLSQMTEAYAKLKCQIAGIDYRSIKESVENTSVEKIDKLTESYANRRLIENSLPFAKNDVKKIRYTRPNQGNYNPTNPDDIYTE